MEYSKILESYIIPDDVLESAFGDKAKALIAKIKEFFRQLFQRIKDWGAKKFTSGDKLHTAGVIIQSTGVTKMQASLKELISGKIDFAEWSATFDACAKSTEEKLSKSLAEHSADSDYTEIKGISNAVRGLEAECKRNMDEAIRAASEENSSLAQGLMMAASKVTSFTLKTNNMLLFTNRVRSDDKK